MAKPRFRLTDDQVGMLREMFAHDSAELTAQLRKRAREVFDDSLANEGQFEAALARVLVAGMLMYSEHQRKPRRSRTTKRRADGRASEGAGGSSLASSSEQTLAGVTVKPGASDPLDDL